MIKVGLTGGVGSGKSVVAEFLNVCGIPVYNSDREAKCLMGSSSIIRNHLIDLFGVNAYINNELNRKYIAEIVFRENEKLLKLNEIVHPAVRIDFEKWAKVQSSNICVVESAILFESGLAERLDRVMAVASPDTQRISRVMKRDGLSDLQVQQRIDAQMDSQLLLAKADYVVINDENRPLIPQILDILHALSHS
ncbi:MAG: dephospho-CoA kinase [Bacteroidales bacterium]|nr:dephospho-CoA kinase [Bacteroidales bacterium]